MDLYVLVDFENAILTSSLASNVEEAKKGFRQFYESLDVHDIKKDIVLEYQNSLTIYKICSIDFEKYKIKKYFKKESKLYE